MSVVSRRPTKPTDMKKNFLTRLFAASLVLAGSMAAVAQTYRVTDLGTLGTNASFATGINASGQVSGYAASGTNAARAWRHTPGVGQVDLGSFGGADNRALGINNAGQVTGYSTTTNGAVRGFIVNGTLADIGGPVGGAGIFPQHINSAGKVAGFSTDTNGNDSAFLFTPPNTFSNLGTIANAALPASSAAYGMNDFGVVVGIGTGSNNFNRAFRSTTNGALEELGTLGGDESWAFAVNNSNQICGSASFVTGDSHAFIFSDATGMSDLLTLGGYTSTAFALDNSGNAVGSAEIPNRTLHAALWPSGGAPRDLDELIPINSGWTLTEARGVNDAGQIVGNGLLNGQPRAFLLTPNSGADTNPPFAVLAANNITNLQYGAQLISITFWDDSAVLAASITTNSVRVTGPGGYDQIATPYSVPVTNGLKLTAQFFVNSSPSFIWNGTNNGVYSVAIEPNTVSDTNGNFMPAASIGTFTVTTETKPLVSIALPPLSFVTMAEPATFTLGGLSSFPYLPTDVFNFTIDWKNDGSDVQTISTTNGAQLTHTYTAIGVATIRVSATDVHGIASANAFTSVNVVNSAFPQTNSASAPLTGSRRLAVGLNQSGTILCLGGLPLKSGRDIVNTLAPGAALFTDAQRLPNPTIGLGAGIDSLNRIIVFGGIEPNAATANVNGYIYTTGGGGGAAIANKTFAVHDFAFAQDNLHRLYSIGGAVGAGTTSGTNGVERYDAAANTWTTLAPLPVARISATASYDGHGHIIVFGGIDPATSAQTSTVFSYDVAANTWTQMANTFYGADGGRVAQLGADNLIYLIGSAFNTQIYTYDSVADAWFNGSALTALRSVPACALGSDGFIYVMGGDNAANGNNGLATTEKFDTGSTNAPQIVSSPSFGTTVQALQTFGYKLIAFGNPRPAYSLVTAPAGMIFNPTNGAMTWTPTTNQVGTATVLFRATNSAGVAEQTFAVTVTPIPPPVGDITPPTTPASISLVFRSATSVTLTWPAATDNVGVTSYTLYTLFRGSRSSHIGPIASGITNRSYIAPGGFGVFYVAAVDAAGNVSGLSAPVSGSVLTLPTIGPVTPGQLPPSVIQGNAFLYNIVASANPGAGFSSFSAPAGMTFTHVSGALTNADYVVVQWQPNSTQVGTNTFTCFATNANTTGSSATFSVVVLPNGTDTVPPTPVAQMTARGISFDRCNLAWTPAGDNIGVVNYHLVATHFGATSNHVVTLDVNGANTNTVLSGLLANAGYTTVINAADAAGNVSSPTSIFFTTLVQPNVTLKISNGATPGTLALSWNGFGAQWKFAVESSDSLTAPNWTALAPASTATNLVVTPNAAMKFFRINSTPALP